MNYTFYPVRDLDSLIEDSNNPEDYKNHKCFIASVKLILYYRGFNIFLIKSGRNFEYWDHIASSN